MPLRDCAPSRRVCADFAIAIRAPVAVPYGLRIEGYTEELTLPFRLRSPLKLNGSKIHSQNDEDGIIDAIFRDIQPVSRFFVEFGIGPHWQDPNYTNGLEGNCIKLREEGWRGLLMDGQNHPEQYGIKREFISALNINMLLRKYNVPDDIDIISIDVDGQDFWIWMACQYRPTLIVIEYNSNFSSLEEKYTVPFEPSFRWDGTKYYGASLGALVQLGSDKGYKLVYANGVNAFFVRSDMLDNSEDFRDEDLMLHVERHSRDDLDRPWLSLQSS